jgi:hypothetical protein
MDVRCTPDESRIEGKARIGFRESGESADTVRFWLHGELRVTAVRAGGVDLEFSQTREYYRRDYSLIGNRVEAQFSSGQVPDSFEVEWSGFFHPSRARSPSDFMRIDEEGVFLRALGYSLWFPVLLDVGEDEHEVDFRRVSIEVPKAFSAAFVGDLLEAKHQGEFAQYLWRAEGASLFEGQLTARPFVIATEGDVHIYALPDAQSQAAGGEIMDLTRSLLEYFRDHYSKNAVSGQVHVVEMPKFGDISSGNVVGIQEDSWRGFGESEWAKRTLAHELVHPFVQPRIASSDPLYALVIEGFPSYYHFPALDHIGEMKYNERIAAARSAYLKKRETGKHRRGWPLPPEKALSEISADEIRKYKDVFILADRALLFLDRLRSQMGERGFDNFNRELFAMAELDDPSFRTLVNRHLPGFEEELRVWLDTTDLPESLSHL